jgi:hypothetical protein
MYVPRKQEIFNMFILHHDVKIMELRIALGHADFILILVKSLGEGRRHHTPVSFS